MSYGRKTLLFPRNAAVVIDTDSSKILLVAFLFKPQGASRRKQCNTTFTLFPHVRVFEGGVSCISQVIQYKTVFSPEIFLSVAAFSNFLASSPVYDRAY